METNISKHQETMTLNVKNEKKNDSTSLIEKGGSERLTKKATLNTCSTKCL